MSVIAALIFATAGVWQFIELGTAPSMGMVMEQHGRRSYSVILDIALEQYLNGERDRARDHQWFLMCESPASSGLLSECRLTRTALDAWGEGLFGTVCNQTTHRMSDGSFELLSATWDQGRLDFNIVHGDGSKTHVLIDMEYKDLSDQPGMQGPIYLKRLKASNTSRGLSGEPYVMEFRVPSYTYVQHVPIVMKGMRPEGDRKWDEVVSRLNAKDKLHIDGLIASRDAILAVAQQKATKSSEGKQLATQFEALSSPDPDEETMEKLQNAVMDLTARFVIVEVDDWLTQRGMSETGIKAVIDFLGGP